MLRRHVAVDPCCPRRHQDRLRAVRDNDGNLSPVVSDKIVLDTTGPKARKLRPKKGADDVAPGTNIKMWSTEALDPATVTKANVVLKTDGHR